jgi:hypothetical protein
MKKIGYSIAVVLAVALTAAVASAAPCPSPTALSVVVSGTYSFNGSSAPSAIYPDSPTAPAYINGVNGVSATINGCTHDAVIDLGKSTRSVGLSLQNEVAGTSYTPSWTAMPFWAQPHIVVSNLFFTYAATQYYQFSTTADIAFTAPDGSSNQLQFVNPSAQASSVQGGLVNTPYNTSLVIVTHIPANYNGGTNAETWTVTPDNANMNLAGTPAATQVAGLLVSQKHGSVNGGQFSMPFQFSITRK